MSRYQYAHEDCEGWTPACPTCKSRQTSFCSITDDGPVYLCSPCCEAFYHEPDEGRDLRARVGRRLFYGTVVFCLALVLAAVAITPRRPEPTAAPPQYRQYAPPPGLNPPPVRPNEPPGVQPRW